MQIIKQEDGYLLFEGIKLDPQVKDKWLAALRSGTYPQGKGLFATVEYEDFNNIENDRIKNVVGYCCLGVCAVVMNPDVENLVDELSHTEIVGIEDTPNFNFPQVLKSDSGNPSLGTYLAALNDGDVFKYNQSEDKIHFDLANAHRKVYSFLEIADYIEKYL